MEPKLADLDRRGSDPAFERSKQALAAARNLAAISGREPELFEMEVPQTLNSLIEEGQTDGTVGRRAAEIAIESTKNVTVLLLRESVGELRSAKDEGVKETAFSKSFWSTSGKIIAGGFAGGIAAAATAFIITYQADIIAFASEIPGGELLKTIVQWIAKAAH